MRRGGIDDAAPAALLHAGHRGADGVKRRGQVDGDDRVPFLDRELLDRRHELDAGIVDEHVDRAEGLFAERDHFGDFGGLGHVGGRVHRLDLEVGLDGGAFLLDVGGRAQMPLITILAPAPAKARAMASPMPLVEPVTTAVLPVKIPILSTPSLPPRASVWPARDRKSPWSGLRLFQPVLWRIDRRAPVARSPASVQALDGVVRHEAVSTVPWRQLATASIIEPRRRITPWLSLFR